MARYDVAFWTGVLIAASAGCNKLVPVNGRVTLDGKPLSRATVMFVPENEKIPSHHPAGATEDDGSFSLRTVNEMGALPGKYKVTVSRSSIKLQKPKYPKGAEPEPGFAPLPGIVKIKELVPRLYTDLQTTPLEVDVPKGGKKDVQIDLISKPTSHNP